MEPLMVRRDYNNNYDAIQVPLEQAPSLNSLQEYDSPILEEIVPEQPSNNSALKCPYCGTSKPFNPVSIQTCKNFSCPECLGNVPSNTVVKLAGNEYVSSIEIVSDENDNKLVEDLKESLKVVKKIEV